MEPRGTTMTTTKPVRQNLDNKVSLTGKVTVNPVFGLVSPVAGQVRYLDVPTAQGTPTKPTRVATVWANGKPSNIEVPAGATFAGRLADDKATVPVGMPVASARFVGYGIVAEIDGAQAYRISDALGSVQAQIKNGPGPFACSVLGTIAALPAGTIPEPPAPTAKPPASGPPMGAPSSPDRRDTEPSTPTGLRLVCTAPPGVKLINGVDATLQVVTEKATNVLTVPVEAVAGSQGKGKVDIVKADNTRETRDVELGLTDGKVVEIRSGLTGEESIAVPGPNLPPGTSEGGPNGKGGKGQ
ncbi:hypothetical protein Lfu02_33190 [Longispora fulva]|nr:hypothetical protein Lfu02_33190 [Longispora fulva]